MIGYIKSFFDTDEPIYLPPKGKLIFAINTIHVSLCGSMYVDEKIITVALRNVNYNW
jgi:hypothetical protein